MGIFNAIFDVASQIDTADLYNELDGILVDDEEIALGFRIIRDLLIFTNLRLVTVDKQGFTGSKVEYHSIPYKSISHFSVETAGTFDNDSELTYSP